MGALTSKPYSFKSRAWELSEQYFFDYLDCFHSPIRLATRSGRVCRILPNLRYSFIDEWISDRIRFSYDSFVTNRSKFIMVRLSSVVTLTFFIPSMSSLWYKSFIQRRFFFIAPVTSDTDLAGANFFLDNLSSAGVNIALDNRYNFQPPVSLSLSQLTKPGRVFTVGIPVRYIQPILAAYLHQHKDSHLQVFEFGAISGLFDYQLGSSLCSFLNFISYKTRFSQYLKGALFFVSHQLYYNFYNFFSIRNSIVLYGDPKQFYSALLGFQQSPQNFMAKKSRIRLFFSPYVSNEFDLLIPHPHPIECNQLVYRSSINSFVFSERVMGSALPLFLSEGVVYSVTNFLGGFSSSYLNASSATRVVYGPSFNNINYYDHFVGSESTLNSPTILLGLHRNELSRAIHF